MLAHEKNLIKVVVGCFIFTATLLYLWIRPRHYEIPHHQDPPRYLENPFAREYEHPDNTRCDLAHRIPRKSQLSKSRRNDLVIFKWSQERYGDLPDWNEFSKGLCTYPPELYDFFGNYWKSLVNDTEARWPRGWAPCWLFVKTYRPQTKEDDDWPWQRCGETRYRVTSNYTEFRDADIVWSDYGFLHHSDEFPYWNEALLPPRVGSQSWWYSVDYPEAHRHALNFAPSFLELFDMTSGPNSLIRYDVETSPYHMTYEEMGYSVWAKANMKDRIKFVTESGPAGMKKVAHGLEDGGIMSYFDSYCAEDKILAGKVEELTSQLGKYVHSFGGCHPNRNVSSKAGSGGNSRRWTRSRYVYGLVIDHDHVPCGQVDKGTPTFSTEMYRVMEAGAVPVYMGKSDPKIMNDYLPEGSWIDASSETDMGKLVDNLIDIASDPIKLGKYYKWKEIVAKDFGKFCKKCLLTSGPLECRMLEQVEWV